MDLLFLNPVSSTASSLCNFGAVPWDGDCPLFHARHSYVLPWTEMWNRPCLFLTCQSLAWLLGWIDLLYLTPFPPKRTTSMEKGHQFACGCWMFSSNSSIWVPPIFIFLVLRGFWTVSFLLLTSSPPSGYLSSSPGSSGLYLCDFRSCPLMGRCSVTVSSSSCLTFPLFTPHTCPNSLSLDSLAAHPLQSSPVYIYPSSTPLQLRDCLLVSWENFALWIFGKDTMQSFFAF